MPISGPSWAPTEKNKLVGGSWILLFELQYSDSPPLLFRLARWSEDVSWNGFTWVRWPIGEISMNQNIQGELPTMVIPVAGVTSFILSILESYALENKKGAIYQVHESHLADNTPVRKTPFTIVSVAATWEQVQFTVVAAQAAFEPLKAQLPLRLVTREEFPGVQGSIITV